MYPITEKFQVSYRTISLVSSLKQLLFGWTGRGSNTGLLIQKISFRIRSCCRLFSNLRTFSSFSSSREPTRNNQALLTGSLGLKLLFLYHVDITTLNQGAFTFQLDDSHGFISRIIVIFTILRKGYEWL